MARPGPETQAKRRREQAKKEKRRAKEEKKALRKAPQPTVEPEIDNAAPVSPDAVGADVSSGPEKSIPD